MPALRRVVLLLVVLAHAATGAAQDLLQGFSDELVVGGLSAPVAFTTLPDGRILIAEKAGVVRIVSGGQLLPDAFIDLRDQVNTYWDRGLLGIAADPAFAQNGFVYLFYVHENDSLTYSGPKTSRVVRVTAVGSSASPASEIVIVGTAEGPLCSALPAGADCLPADSPSHDGGALRFGPDGALWITTGDASSFNAVDPRALRAQQVDSLAGKLLRVGKDGRGLPDNPFWSGNGDDARAKVWAYGLRNPFRLTFSPSSGRPYVAEVGAGAWEEVNALTAGGNYGWPCYEGVGRQAGYETLAGCQALYALGPAAVVNPVVAYPHLTGTAAIAGGAFYSGTEYPELYRGVYFFGDFVRGTLQYVALGEADGVAGPIKGFASGIDGPVDVQTDAHGIVYLSVTRGELRRIVHTADTGLQQTIYLSDAPEAVTFAVNGGGPVELDRSHGGLDAGDGGPLTIGGTTFAKGLGVQAPSDLRFALGGMCRSFSVLVGIDDETRGQGSVNFEVWLDGELVAASGLIRGGSAAVGGTLDVTGRQELRLVVTDGGDGSVSDHADWASARLECLRPGGDTLPPQVVATAPAADATGVAVDSAATATFSEGLNAGSVGVATATLTDAGSGVSVAAAVVYDSTTRRVVLTPATPLAGGVRYLVTMVGGAGGLTDTAGNALAMPYVWHFTTAAPVLNQAPVPVVTSPPAGLTFRVGELLSFAGGATDPEDGAVPPTRLQWSVSVRHCPGGVCHTHALTSGAGAAISVTAPEHGADSYLLFALTATDSGGRAATVTREVRPRLVAVTLHTSPPGLPVVFGEDRALSPATFSAVSGSHMTVATLSPQYSLSFVSWDSGAEQEHGLVIGDVDVVDTARFTTAAGVSFLSDLAWSSATSGAGPVKRDRNHSGSAGDGPPITLRGATYAKGLGVLATSDIRFRLNGACSSFASTVGIDDDVQGGGTVIAGVFVDDRLVFQTGLIDGGAAPILAAVDLTGVSELRLMVVDAGD
ncbi:MAG: NPCBM/NEW2 domain-containing protein, partial [Acidobacteriota bacterium]